MKHVNQNLIRYLYAVLTILSIIAAVYCYKYVVNDTVKFNAFSYVGTVATLIALMITIFEIIHSLRISKSIRDEVRTILENVKLIEGASSVSECVSALDEVSQAITREDYHLALNSFRYFRKIYGKVSPTIRGGIDLEVPTKENKLSILGEIEGSLQTAIHTTPEAPFGKPKKKRLEEQVLKLKDQCEYMNPARGAKDKNATT